MSWLLSTPGYALPAVQYRLRWLRVRLRHRALRRAPSVCRLGRDGEIETTRGAIVRIGSNCVVKSRYFLSVRGTLRIGTEFFANRDFYLACYEAVTIGDRVRIGERVSIHDENHVHARAGFPGAANRDSYRTAPVTVGSDVWIGANVVILPGSTIGDGSVIGAGSVVRGVVPPHVVAAGSPATPIRKLDAG